MIIYGGYSGLARAPSPARWSTNLDSDFVQYLIEGLRRLLRAQSPVDVNLISGFRSYAKQAQLYRQNPSKAARPGLSQHEYGFAVDLSITFPPDPTYANWFAILVDVVSMFAPGVVDYPDLTSQGLIELIWGGLLYPRSNDPGHLAFYSDEDWHAALQAAGYFDYYTPAQSFDVAAVEAAQADQLAAQMMGLFQGNTVYAGEAPVVVTGKIL